MRQAQVAASRRREAQRLDAIREVHNESIIKSRANWEHQGQKVIERNYSQGSKYRVHIARSDSLNQRRNRLRTKLDNEAKRLVDELAGQGETPQMKRERMLLRARMIKERTEAERRMFVDRAYEQQFRLECDELRTTQTEMLTSHCKDIRNEQLKQKALNGYFQKEQDTKFDKLWLEEMNRKAEREKHDAERQITVQQDTNEAVAKQLQELRQRQRAAEQLREAEKEIRLKLETQMQRERQENDVQQRDAFMKKRQEAMEYTQKSLDEKLQAARQERELDKEYIKEVLAREARKKQYELEKKSMTSQDLADFLDYTRAAKESRRIREKQLDMMRQAELDAEMQRRDEILRQENEARNNLNTQVLRERCSQIGIKKSRLQQEKLEAKRDRQRIIDEHAAANAQERETDLLKRNMRVKIQDEQMEQIHERQHIKLNQAHETDMDREQLKVERERYEQRLAAMRQIDADRKKLFGADNKAVIEQQHAVYAYPRKKLIT